MAKTPARTTRVTKKKLQDVMESLEETAPPPAVEEPAPAPASKFVEAPAPKAGRSAMIGAAAPADDDEDGDGDVMIGGPGRRDYEEGAIDRETHEKYERVKRGELHITDLQKMNVTELHEVAKQEGIEEYVGLTKQDLIFNIDRKSVV